MDSDLRVHHRAGANGAFTVERASEQLGTLTYTRKGTTITLVNTAIADDIQGQGVGSALVRAAIAYAEEAQLGVDVICPWATEYLKRHPELLPSS